MREILYTIVESDRTHNRTFILLMYYYTALSPFSNCDGNVYLRKAKKVWLLITPETDTST